MNVPVTMGGCLEKYEMLPACFFSITICHMYLVYVPFQINVKHTWDITAKRLVSEPDGLPRRRGHQTQLLHHGADDEQLACTIV